MNAKTIRVEHVRFPASKDTLAEKFILGELGDFRSEAAYHFAKYDEALKTGQAIKVIAGNLATSFPVRIVSAITMNKRQRFCRRKSLVELWNVAGALNLKMSCSEPVPTYPKMKPNGDFRAISNFGPMHRTAQTLGRLMLQRHVQFRGWQYDFLGVAAAIKAVCDAILAGRRAVVHVDVKGFYSSFDYAGLRKALPVPGWLVDHYLTARKLEIVPVGCPQHLLHDLLAKARSGVSHGSSVSPIIGAGTISRIKWHPGPGVTAAGYVDDVLLAAATDDLVNTKTKLLQAALAALPTGHFVGVVKWKGDAADGFTYLGHHVRLVGDKVEISPAPGRWEKFQQELATACKQAYQLVLKAALMDSADNRRAALQAVCDAWEFAEGWLAAFRMCDDIAVYREKATAPVSELLNHLGCDLKALGPYKNGGTKWPYPI